MSLPGCPPGSALDAPRILLVSGRYPFPTRDGSDRRVTQLGRALRDFDVHLLVDEDPDDPATRRVPDDGFAAVHSVPGLIPSRNLARRALRRLRRPRFDDRVFWNHVLIDVARAIDAERRIDAILIETVRYAWVLDALPKCRPHIIDAVDIWHERYLAYAAMGKGALLDHYRDPAREMARYGAADLTLAISSHDIRAMREAGVPDDQVLSVPMAFEPQPIPSVAVGPELLFAGASSEANEEAAIHLADRVLPLIRGRVPGARLSLLRVPEGLRSRFADREDIRCLPYLEDIDDAYRAARVVVVPLLRGSGIKIKVLEAFSRGAATIITPAAAQGIELEGFAQERISAEPDVLADEIVRALSSSEYRDALSRSGLEVIERHYRPERIHGPLREALVELVWRRRPAPFSPGAQYPHRRSDPGDRGWAGLRRPGW